MNCHHNTPQWTASCDLSRAPKRYKLFKYKSSSFQRHSHLLGFTVQHITITRNWLVFLMYRGGAVVIPALMYSLLLHCGQGHWPKGEWMDRASRNFFHHLAWIRKAPRLHPIDTASTTRWMSEKKKSWCSVRSFTQTLPLLVSTCCLQDS